eukprot:3936294-Amphidinium_carterae.1
MENKFFQKVETTCNCLLKLASEQCRTEIITNKTETRVSGGESDKRQYAQKVLHIILKNHSLT